MLGRERLDHVAGALDRLPRLHLRHIDAKADALDAELRRAPQMPARPARPPQPERLDAPLKRHRPHQPNDANDVVGMEVREEDVLQHERDAVAHHLTLRPFAAIEQHRLSLADDRERADVALDRGASGGRAEEAETQ